jgi:hypothetical protein
VSSVRCALPICVYPIDGAMIGYVFREVIGYVFFELLVLVVAAYSSYALRYVILVSRVPSMLFVFRSIVNAECVLPSLCP